MVTYSDFSFRQRAWQSNGHRMLGSQKIGATSACSSGLPRDLCMQNGDITEDRSLGGQPLYLDRTPDNFQRSQFQSKSFFNALSAEPAQPSNWDIGLEYCEMQNIEVSYL